MNTKICLNYQIKKAVFLLIFTVLSILSLFRSEKIVAAGLSTEEIYREINQTRANNNLPALRKNSALTLAAERKAQDMINYGYWSHANPTTGDTPWKFIVDAGFKGKYAGENLAKDYSNTQTLVNAWVTSPTHKQNLLSANYQETGIAIATGQVSGKPRTIIVQMFGGVKK